jgi:hypothetical protein
MGRKTNAFTNWVGKAKGLWNRFSGVWSGPKASPKMDPPPRNDLSPEERLNARFERLMDDVDNLSHAPLTVEERGEYLWIVLIRVLVPIVFFCAFGYEDGMFMTGFRYFTWAEPFIVIMFVIGYCLEGIRVAMVFSMIFSKSTPGASSAYWKQFTVWVVMSLGCGVAQLAAAIVIQALGGDGSVTGGSAVASAAHTIMARIPFLIYAAILIRVVLCALADWACSSFLHKRTETVEQRVATIELRGTNFQKVIQANVNADTIRDNARHYQEVVKGERDEIKGMRERQTKLFEIVYQAGMKHVERMTDTQDDDPYKA